VRGGCEALEDRRRERRRAEEDDAQAAAQRLAPSALERKCDGAGAAARGPLGAASRLAFKAQRYSLDWIACLNFS
jgi:hypothetical protein